MIALEPKADGSFGDGKSELSYKKCQNNAEHGVCNWMVDAADSGALCLACRLNNVIPNLEIADDRALWGEVEMAKRRLLYTLLRLQLPLVPKLEDPEHGLAFDIKADDGDERVLTGHAHGLITLNLAEADAVAREKMRVTMKERYRTLLGHFRHEIGHYYWDRLTGGAVRRKRFRALFGDERSDYAQALQRHYDSAVAPAAAPDDFISSYSAAHPWEDWAEIFAHYLHILDTLETAQQFGFTADVEHDASLSEIGDFDLLLREWADLTVALNALNRSMGLPDAYPFAISAKVREKLEFVHLCVSQCSGAGRRASSANRPRQRLASARRVA